MKSKVEFSLDGLNNSVIKALIVKEESEDVRDLVARSFLEGFQYTSNFAVVAFSGPIGQETVTIKPLPCLMEEYPDAPFIIDDKMGEYLKGIHTNQLKRFIEIFKNVIAQRAVEEAELSKENKKSI